MIDVFLCVLVSACFFGGKEVFLFFVCGWLVCFVFFWESGCVYVCVFFSSFKFQLEA